MLELLKGPYDVWNLAGAGFGALVAALNLLVLRFMVQPQMMQQAGDDADRRREAEAAYARMRQIMFLSGVVLLLAGFFFVGPVFRDAFGS